jgi:hypothetical protein
MPINLHLSALLLTPVDFLLCSHYRNTVRHSATMRDGPAGGPTYGSVLGGKLVEAGVSKRLVADLWFVASGRKERAASRKS